jgi:Cdc6-like AAA superfamily ATPase
MNYEIKAIPTSKTNIPQCQGAMDGVVFKHPFRLYIVGASGSGKSNLLLNLMSRTEFYKGYFDEVFVISPTANELDDSYAILDLPPERFFQPNVEVLSVIESIQKKNIEKKGIGNAPKILIILDDVISYRKFTSSKQLLKLFVMGRHYGISLCLLSQAYHRILKSIRLNMSCMIYFKGSLKESQTIFEDYCPPGYSKKECMEMIHSATRVKWSFLCIDLHKSIEDGRYRKGLTENLVKSVHEE